MRTIFHAPPVIHVVVLLSALLLFHEAAFAHGIRVFAYTSGPEIVVEGKFSSGRATINSKVKVFSTKSGKLLVEGKTGKDGMFSFSRPGIAADEGLKIVLVAGEGHQAQWTMTPEDLSEEPMPAEPAPAPAETTAETAGSAAVSTTTGAPAPTPEPAIDTRVLAEVVSRSVAREIAPLKRMMMEEMNRGPSMTEIIGGIGWLVGIGGLLAALAAQKKK